MKVLIVFNHPAPYKVAIFNELAKYVDLTVIFERKKASDRPDTFYRNNKYEFNAIFIDKGNVGREGNISSAVRKYIKNHFREYDHIVMNGYSHLAEIKAIKYMHSHHIRFSLLINGGVIKEKECSLKRKFKSSLVKAADFYMSPSKPSDDYLIYYGAKKERIYRYPYSNLSLAELSKDNLDKELLRKKLNLPLDKKIFVNASQFIERKNNIQLLKAFLNRKKLLLLIGSGKQEEEYRSFIKEHHMDNVKIIPYLEKKDLFEYYQASDAFISLAKEDIFGHTILEALASSLPVIASNKINSALEYIKNGHNGYVVDLHNEDEIQKAINNVTALDNSVCKNSIKDNTFENSGRRLSKILEEENK